MRILTLDRKRPANPKRTSRAERTYAVQLRAIAEHVGKIIVGFPPGDPQALPRLNDMLRRYADLIEPWAANTAAAMLNEADQADINGWRRLSGAISESLRKEIIGAPTGDLFRQLQLSQVELIRSLPLDAAQRVHDLTMKGLEDGSRAKEIAEEILRSGEVSKNRATLIARTEVSRAASNFTQARAEHVGSEGYVWRTSKDGAVRPSHRAMNGALVRWDAPPTLDGMTGHAGCLPNCRCWADIQ